MLAGRIPIENDWWWKASMCLSERWMNENDHIILRLIVLWGAKWATPWTLLFFSLHLHLSCCPQHESRLIFFSSSTARLLISLSLSSSFSICLSLSFYLLTWYIHKSISSTLENSYMKLTTSPGVNALSIHTFIRPVHCVFPVHS